MTPEHFIAQWRGSTRSERSAAHEHFLGLCEVLEVPKPADAGPHAADYTFEKLTKRLGRGRGYADVWKKHCFAWEYKGPRKNLVEAYAQLKSYADDLENPPLLIVSDMQEIRVHTNWTNTVAEEHVVKLADLTDPDVRRMLKACFEHPERLKPTGTPETVTARAATAFGEIAQGLRRNHDPQRVAHFINKLVFCLFAEDIDLLPDRVFAEIIAEAVNDPKPFAAMLGDLFAAMREQGGRFGTKLIMWFNGGLFDNNDVLPITVGAAGRLEEAARLDWSHIDPTIFGSLFESGLDDKRRAEMASLFDRDDGEPPKQRALFDRSTPGKGVGIHYTHPDTIRKIIEPVVMRPLRAEWDDLKAEIRALDEQRQKARSPKQKAHLLEKARGLYGDFRKRLGRFRVLDPACGSGNFLALALLALKDFDYLVMKEATSLDLPPDNQRVGPEAVLGIEINPYAAELARLTVWIAELQWQLRNGFNIKRRPVLGRLDGIVCRDALVNRGGTEASWPKADVIIGNPPFLGGKLMRKSLGDSYIEMLFKLFAGRVPAEADLVTYWFAKAWETVHAGTCHRVGLVATNSIRGGANRRVLARVVEEGAIFDAWSDEPWVIDGVAVRVSLVCFGKEEASTHLDGRAVQRINADLTASISDLTTARRLPENHGVAFMGDTKGGAFDIPGELARRWLALALNPNGRPNCEVLCPWVNGMDLTRRSADKWIIDFGGEMSEAEAALYEAPFAYALKHVKPDRLKNRRENYRLYWWRHVEPRPGMWNALGNGSRYLATVTVGKHRVFAWFPTMICPDHQLIVLARGDDTAFGILHSRFHEMWALRLGTSLEDRPRYTPSTTFETFPFPRGLTPNMPASAYGSDPRAVAIANAARRLDELRTNWLNPTDLVEIVPEVVPGYPDRILPKNAAAAAILKKRTLTNLYNERPAWLDNAHRDLDAAVAAAYGWPANISDEDALARLLALNHARSNAEAPVPGGTGKRRRKAADG